MFITSVPQHQLNASQKLGRLQHFLKCLAKVLILESVNQHLQSSTFHDGFAGNHGPFPQSVVGNAILCLHGKWGVCNTLYGDVPVGNYTSGFSRYGLLCGQDFSALPAAQLGPALT